MSITKKLIFRHNNTYKLNFIMTDILASFDIDGTKIDISNKCIEGKLDLSRFTKLKEFYCQNNEITELTFNYWCELNIFDFTNNPIINIHYPINKIIKFSNSITHLTFGYEFNQDVGNLPNSITHLTFGDHFNQNVSNLPNSITHLTFGFYFNQYVDNLPNSVTYLTFGCNFNQTINKYPDTLTKIGFWSYHEIKNNLPQTIETCIIYFNGFYYDEEITNLPISISKIKIQDKKFLKYLKKIPFGCKVYDFEDNLIEYSI